MMPLLPSDDLWRDRNYRRLWLSILIGSFGGQLSSMALSLMSAIMLGATPMQLGFLGAFWIAPFIFLSLPLGVWLDRVRKLPVYIAGEIVMVATLASITLAWSLGYLGMSYLYGVSFVTGCISVISGTAAQIVLTQVVPRERLVEAHARNGLATSSAGIAGPGAAGMLIKLIGAPFALLANAMFMMVGVLLLRGIHVDEQPAAKKEVSFWRDLKEGVRFVLETPLLRSLALVVGAWQICQGAAMVVQVLFATRTLLLSEYQYGLCFSAAGIGTILASMTGHRLSRRIGPGPCFIAGIAISSIGWLQLAWAPTDAWGVVSFVAMLLCFSAGTVLIFSNMLALRQSITPPSMLARMTSTMRLMTLLPAGVGGLLGGYIGESFGLRAAIAFGGLGAVALAVFVWRFSLIRRVDDMPKNGV
ncbi:MAG: MFS transporter [Gallionella sp.]|jgi:MFS family permease|nr:MFS transporter [Gallionella sp.]MCK9353723.1 MFS transporter [Gallionella sp.]